MSLLHRTGRLKCLQSQQIRSASLQTHIACCFSSVPVSTDTTDTVMLIGCFMPSQVPVQPSEWHRTLLLPQAWLSFMNRAYNACVEVR